jgi:Domain of unknown function (DUF4124)/Uncharacterized protein conserved in bacteria (DUF2059)
MRRVLVVLIALGLVVPALPAAARTYRWVDKSGQVIYSDHPPQADEMAPPSETPASSPSASIGPRRPVHPSASELLEFSGLKEHMKVAAVQARQNVHQSLGHLEPRDLESVEAVTAQTLDPDRIFEVIVDEFSQTMDEAKIAEVRSWYRSPLGRKLTELEVRASAEDRERQLAAFMAEWKVKPPAPERVALIQRLDAAGGATELSVDVVVGISQAIARVADPHLPPERRLRPGQLDAQARQIRLYTLEAFRQGNTVAMLYLYRDVADEDLARFVQFLETEAGAWYGNALRRSIVQGLAAAVERTATNLVRIVPPERWGGPGGFKKPAPPPEEKQL